MAVVYSLISLNLVEGWECVFFCLCVFVYVCVCARLHPTESSVVKNCPAEGADSINQHVTHAFGLPEVYVQVCGKN